MFVSFLLLFFFFFSGTFVIKIQYKIIDGLFVLYNTEAPLEHRGHHLGYLIAQVCINCIVTSKGLIFIILFCFKLISSL